LGGILISFYFLIIFGCSDDSSVVRESWFDKPINEWPDFALTNEISFADTTFNNSANSFLVDTGYDTIGVSCKHLFLVFKKYLDYEKIKLENDYRLWSLFPKNKPQNIVPIKRIINQNKNSLKPFNPLRWARKQNLSA